MSYFRVCMPASVQDRQYFTRVLVFKLTSVQNLQALNWDYDVNDRCDWLCSTSDCIMKQPSKVLNLMASNTDMPMHEWDFLHCRIN